MRTCPNCRNTYADDMEYCSRDATPLPPPSHATELDLSLGLSRRYRVVRRLGAGGMGTVFLAEQIAVGNRLVALKILRRSLLEDPEFLKRFQDEASSTGRIRHQNVVTVYECGQSDDGSPYIAMEYLEGETLRQYLQREKSIPLDQVAEILQQAARGLNAAHKLGIIHRDLKPDNVFLTKDDDGKLLVKIVDFGIAKMRESTTHTMTGLAVGTPRYMSVEQAAGMRSDQIDGRSDIYSLGMVVYEMIAGAVPFHADTPLAYVQKHLTEPPAPFRITRPDLDIPPPVERVVMKAINKDRDQRYATVPEFGRAFTEALTGTAAAIETTPIPQTATSQPYMLQTAPQVVQKERRPVALIAAAALVVVLAIIAAVLYLLRGKSEPGQPAAGNQNVETQTATAAATIPSPQPAPTTATTPAPRRPPAPVVTRTPPAPVVTRTPPAPVVTQRTPPDIGHALDLIRAQRYAEAFPILQQAAAAGNVAGELYLADAYRNAWGVTQDYVKAHHWYEKAAAGGNIVAALDLGGLYERGQGVQQDYNQALRWYEKAATAGNSAAMVDLARLYEHGQGAPQDYGQARQWLERAAGTGNGAAMLDVGHLYENGWGVPKDDSQARQWYQKALDAGNQNAESALAHLAEREPSNRQNGTKAAKFSQNALALFQKARHEWDSGDRARAFQDIDAALADSPNYPAAYLFRAEWNASVGQTQAALADYTACIERKPIAGNLIAAYRGRAKVKERLGDSRGAQSDEDLARKLQSGNQ